MRACLERAAGVRRLTIEPAATSGIVTCLVEVDDPGVAETVAAALAADGLPLAEVTEDRADLESVFLAVTAGATEYMGGPEMAPQTPQPSEAPRRSRGAPRPRDSSTGTEPR